MKVDVVQLPRLLAADQLAGQIVVVFDVLRATTTMTAALEAGVSEIRVFDSPDAADIAYKPFTGKKLLLGEVNALPPPGFDLGNSPGVFTPQQHAGATLFMATTNGTRALVAASYAPVVIIGALVNAFAVARTLRSSTRDVTLLCSGTAGEFSDEDQIGAGAVIHFLKKSDAVDLSSQALAAHKQFESAQDDLEGTLRETIGGHNCRRVGLDADIAFAARLDLFKTVGRLSHDPLRILAT